MRRNSQSAESHRARVSRLQRRTDAKKLTVCRIKPSGTRQSPSSAEPTRKTHSLPNQATGHASVAIQRRTDAKKLTLCRIKPSGTRQSPSSAEPTRRNSQSAESHRARVSRHPAPNRREETHCLPNQAIGHASVAIQRRTDAKKLTVCRIKPSGTRQSPSSAEPTRRNSQSAESSHRARVSRHPAPNRREETHRLPNQAVGHPSVAIQRRTDAKELTLCRSQSPSSAEPTLNSHSVEPSHQARVSRHSAPNRR